MLAMLFISELSLQRQTAALSRADTTLTALSMIDYLINSWTREQRQEELSSGLKATLELPGAHAGYFPTQVKQLAKLLDTTYHIPKGVTLAQWALESRWGLSDLGASNYFGHTFRAVRDYMKKPRFVLVRERIMKSGHMMLGDTVRFARYSNIAECFSVHGMYLSRSMLYKSAFAESSPEKFAVEIARHYASDPDYALKLITIMRRYRL